MTLNSADLTTELSERGYDLKGRTLVNVMHQLKRAGYLDCTATGGDIALVRLEQRGRQEVEGWPTSPGSAADVQALLEILVERGQDLALPEPERSKARAAAGAFRELGVSVAAEVIGAWLKRQGVG